MSEFPEERERCGYCRKWLTKPTICSPTSGEWYCSNECRDRDERGYDAVEATAPGKVTLDEIRSGEHQCKNGWWEYDAQGIELCHVSVAPTGRPAQAEPKRRLTMSLSVSRIVRRTSILLTPNFRS